MWESMMPALLLECEAVDAWSLVSVSRSIHVQLIYNLFPTLTFRA